MDIFELISEEHRRVEALLDELDRTATDDLDRRAELFARLRQALDTHTELEEEIFYAALKDVGEASDEDGRDPADAVEEAEEAHEEIDGMLDDLESMPMDDEEWGERLKELRLEVMQHVRQEESEIFDDARQAFSRQELTELAERWRDRKAQLDAPR